MTSRRIFLAREMTKQYETLMQGSATELLAQLATPPKGEFVGIIESGEEMTQQFQHQQVMQILLQELSPAKRRVWVRKYAELTKKSCTSLLCR